MKTRNVRARRGMAWHRRMTKWNLRNYGVDEDGIPYSYQTTPWSVCAGWESVFYGRHITTKQFKERESLPYLGQRSGNVKAPDNARWCKAHRTWEYGSDACGYVYQENAETLLKWIAEGEAAKKALALHTFEFPA
jgi:hypothetical protein